MKSKYVVLDNNKFITVIMDDTPCTEKPYTSSLCGGCSECLRLQAEYAGFDVVPYTTMNEEYNDGVDHIMCEKCGFCIECGDCVSFGCGLKNDI